jgi:DNA-binding LacI/PurR family transcriptional regulator
MKKVCLVDVAERAGVSRGAVSQVMNGDVRGRISEPTKERIFAAMKELGYQPNRMARALSRGKTDCVGLMLSGFHNPFYVAVLEHSERLLAEAGYQLLLDSSSLHSKSEAPGKLHGWNIDGLLIYSSPREVLDNYLGESAKTLPVVRVGATKSTDDCVIFDVRSGARQAIEYSLKRGYKRIAHVTPCELGLSRSKMDGRLASYYDVCREAGLPLEVLPLNGVEEMSGGLRIGVEIAHQKPRRRPRVVMCHNDVTAIGVIHGLRRSGLRVPEDVAVVGFDGIAEGQLLDKPLTTVEMPVEELCRRAVELLLLRIEEKQKGTLDDEKVVPSPLAKRKKIIIPTQLIIGETA